MPDTDAAGLSTARQQQLNALQKQDPKVKLDKSTEGQHNIKFGQGETTSVGTTHIATPIGTIAFQVLPTSTPFLLCLKDMDALKVKLDNLENMLIQDNKRTPITRKLGHPWMLLPHQEQQTFTTQPVNTDPNRNIPPSQELSQFFQVPGHSQLSEQQIRQLHRRFGHPSAGRLVRLLSRAGFSSVDPQLVEYLNKICHFCQLNKKAPGRFKFSLKDNLIFNAEIIVDIMYL
jgi:hypothetical protein